ncbi:hypothetical protein SAMN05216315_12135 [Nitrosospira sp. Nsp18]|uniref:hypothetical protein n=1 Tax=Nitrosospira sp. Nsp18 TaxID=1855334 RepID=UPI000883B5A9|nr:hypothetical protein [Nitrosospira sp. Nsp18]SDA23673.1 hypothetical protein SAMN05216315_12135 [Nitrosospira sp. Nsp18]
MKKIQSVCLVVILLGSIPGDLTWARGGVGGGQMGGGRVGGGNVGGGHFGGGHFGGGHGGPGFRGGGDGGGPWMGTHRDGMHWGGHHRGHRGHGYRGYGYGFGGYGLGLGLGYGLGYYGYGWGPPYYYPPYYTSLPATVVPPAPLVYIQRPDTVPPTSGPVLPSNYWYYCENPEGYYPEVKECTEGWLQVAPRPPDQ